MHTYIPTWKNMGINVPLHACLCTSIHLSIHAYIHTEDNSWQYVF